LYSQNNKEGFIMRYNIFAFIIVLLVGLVGLQAVWDFTSNVKPYKPEYERKDSTVLNVLRSHKTLNLGVIERKHKYYVIACKLDTVKSVIFKDEYDCWRKCLVNGEERVVFFYDIFYLDSLSAIATYNEIIREVQE